MFRPTVRLLATALALLQAHLAVLSLTLTLVLVLPPQATTLALLPVVHAQPTAPDTAPDTAPATSALASQLRRDNKPVLLPHTKSQRPPSSSHTHHGGGGGGGSDFARRNLRTISRIYNLTVYPNQLPIFQAGGAGVPAGLFSQDVVGRVDPVGNFTGFEHSIEYFFALSPLPQGNAASAAITSYQIVSFSSQCRDVAASVVYLYCSVVEEDQGGEEPGGGCGGKGKRAGKRRAEKQAKKKRGRRTTTRTLPPLKQVAFWRFDDAGAVVKYDAWIPNLNSWVEATTAARVTDPAFRAASIRQICEGTQARCTGANRQWATVDECADALAAKKYGTYDEAWGDNVVCRSIHLVLTQVRPDVHCPHVGPTGGGKCVDVSYPENYFSDKTLYGQPAGETFMC